MAKSGVRIFSFKLVLMGLISILCLTITSLIISVFQVEMLRRITDSLWNNDYNDLKISLLGFLIVVFVNFVIILTNKCVSFRIIKNIIFYMEDRAIDNYINAEWWPDDYNEQILSYLRKIISETVRSVANLITGSYSLIIILIGSSVYGFKLNSFLLILTVIITIIMVIFSGKALGKLPKLYESFIEYNKRMYNLVWEQIKNREIAGFLVKEKVIKNYSNESEQYIKSLKKIKKSSNGPNLFATFGSTFLIILTVLFGGSFVISGRLKPADLLAFIMLVPTISTNFFSIPRYITNWKESKGRVDKIKELYGRPLYQKYGKSFINEQINNIQLEKVSYEYGIEKVVLDDISLRVSAGIFYVMTGESGSGKSTLIKILANVLPKYSGSIKINDLNLSDLEREEYWKKIVYITQDPIILHGTIVYNITMSQEEYDEERMQAALEDTYMDRWINSQKNGIFTVIDSNSLSRGEIQRINLARALYKKSEILLIDEATEALDPSMEIGILNSLKKRASEHNIIIIFITHKYQLINSADQVIFLSNGHIEEVNTCQNLLSQNERFRFLIEGVRK